MNFLEGLVVATVATGLLSAFVPAEWRLRAARVHVALAVLALAILVALFLLVRLEISAVFFYTRSDLDWIWRVVGTWASRQGSFLVWSTALSVMAYRLTRQSERNPETRLAARIMQAVAAIFWLGVALDNPFNPTPAHLLAGRPGGNGLAPSLRSAYMVIHPPMMFVAYALSTVPAVAAWAHWVKGTPWSTWIAGWVRWAWVVTTCAMGLGALWAYTTLGFGGYWAWDPVEVANLLPWLALTVLLHVRLQNQTHGDFARIGPFLATLPFLFTVFSTISTRSGLWVSVHAFTDPTNAFNPDAAARFLDILRVEPALAYPVGLALAIWWISMGLWAWHLRNSWPGRVLGAAFVAIGAASWVDARGVLGLAMHGVNTLGIPVGFGLLGVLAVSVLGAAWPIFTASGPQRKWRLEPRLLAGYAVLALALALMVLFLFHMSAVNGWSTGFYEDRFPYMALPILGGLAGFAALGLGRRAAMVAAVGVPAMALVLGRIAGPMWILVAAGIVLVGLGLQRVWASLGPARRDTLGAFLLVVAAAVDVVFWAHPPAMAWGIRLPGPPASFILLGASLVGLAAAVRIACGLAPKRVGVLFLAVGLLGGYVIAAPLALTGYVLYRRQAAESRVADARIRQVALQGIHIALALALVGYGTSTYAAEEATLVLPVGQAVSMGDWHFEYNVTQLDGIPAQRVVTWVAVTRGSDVQWIAGHWHFESPLGAHLALPEIQSHGDGDVYMDLEAVHVAPGGKCPNAPDGRWVEAFAAQNLGRLCQGDAVDAIRVKVAWLPGVGVLWGAWVLGLLAVIQMARSRYPSRTAHASFDSS